MIVFGMSDIYNVADIPNGISDWYSNAGVDKFSDSSTYRQYIRRKRPNTILRIM